MSLKGIIAISGRPGIFKVVAQGKNNVIVESMLDKKRFPAYASERISTLEDISVFTYDEDVKLSEVFKTMQAKYKADKSLSHKEELPVLEKELRSFLPTYDENRVYASDIRKLFQWYNLLHDAGLLVDDKAEETLDSSDKKEVKEVKTSKTEKKKASSASKDVVSKAPKAASIKKAAPVKTGSSRGK
jgi:hypothetical protein